MAKTYDFAKNTMVANGITVKDFGENAGVTIEMTNQISYYKKSTTRGSGTHCKGQDMSGTATLSILANSDTWINIIQDMNRQDGDYIHFDCNIIDNNAGTVSCKLLDCTWQSLPIIEKGELVGEQDIVISFANVEYYDGNATP